MPGERGAGTCRRSGWCCSFRARLGPFLGTVTRLQVGDLGHPQRTERPGSLRGDRLGGQADVVAALIEQRYAAYRQPVGALPEHRSAARPGIHVVRLTGQARMSYRRAAEIFTTLTRQLDTDGRGWTLHQLSAAGGMRQVSRAE